MQLPAALEPDSNTPCHTIPGPHSIAAKRFANGNRRAVARGKEEGSPPRAQAMGAPRDKQLPETRRKERGVCGGGDLCVMMVRLRKVLDIMKVC